MASNKTKQTTTRKQQTTTTKRESSKKPNARKTPIKKQATAKKRPSLSYEIVGLILIAVAFITMFVCFLA